MDIQIAYTGLRPGEKLFEELLMQDEGLDKTPNELIYIGHFHDYDEQQLIEALKELRTACDSNSEHIRDLVKSLVRTYHPEEAPPADTAVIPEEASPSPAETISNTEDAAAGEEELIQTAVPS